MRNFDVNKTTCAWASLASAVFVLKTEQEYVRLSSLLDDLIDEAEDVSHPLASLMEIRRRVDSELRKRAPA